MMKIEGPGIFRGFLFIAKVHSTGRSSIPKTPVLESRSRGVLDTRMRRYDGSFEFKNPKPRKTIAFLRLSNYGSTIASPCSL
jgi:hypothetical protein